MISDRIWEGMKQRCYNPNATRYEEYGGRGIYVCQEWLGNTAEEGFLAFKKWAMENGYRDDLSIDRINVDGPYAPYNCQWATDEEQNWNKQNTTYFSINGTMFNPLQIAQLYNANVSPALLSRRLVNESAGYMSWSFNDKLYVSDGLTREQYRKQYNINDVFSELPKVPFTKPNQNKEE